MGLTKKEIEMLQELLILIYKLIHQDSTYKSFYFKDINIDKQPESESRLINEFYKLKNPEKMLKSCIIELEELKEDKNIDKDFFHKIIEEYRTMDLKEKYNIVNIGDIDKWGIEKMLKRID